MSGIFFVNTCQNKKHFVRDVSFGNDVRFAREDAKHITSLCDQREQNITVR